MATTIDPIETSQQPISDDQELAKVLAGINQEADSVADASVEPTVAPLTDDTTAATPAPEPVADPVVAPAPVVEPAMPDPVAMTAPAPVAAVSGDLTTVKSDAINELRPLVDKLSLPAEEKFDTYLLLLRSTDDRSLIEPAHEIAKQITDETRRAQALLDIIKEIDFLSQSQQ